MSMSKIPTGGMLYEGALFGAGVLGAFLWRKDVLPKYMGIISIGAASFGLCTLIWHILKGKDKRSNVDSRPIDEFYKEIASQVNEELTQQDSQLGGLEVERHTVRETEEFDPIAYLRSGTKLYEIYKKLEEPSNSGNYLKACADRFRLKEASKSETKVDESSSVDPLVEFPPSEDKPPINEMAVKKKRAIPELSKIKLSLLDASSEMPCFKGQSSQNIPGPELRRTFDDEFVTVHPTPETSRVNWRNVRELLQHVESKNEKK